LKRLDDGGKRTKNGEGKEEEQDSNARVELKREVSDRPKSCVLVSGGERNRRKILMDIAMRRETLGRQERKVRARVGMNQARTGKPIN